jgi:RHS repeat-associated protein
LTYRYDNIGNVLSITDTKSFATPQYQRFTYDPLDRLIAAAVTGAITGTYNETYAFNQIGNITNTNRLGNYVYGAKPHAVTNAGSNQYTYDTNGNMLTRIEGSGSQRITYTQQWDAENRLVVVTNTKTLSVTRFVYDGDGNRVLQVRSDGSQTAYVGNLLDIDIRPITSAVVFTPTGWSGRVTRSENGAGVSGASLALIKREACSGNGTLRATIVYGSGGPFGPTVSQPDQPDQSGNGSGTLYLYRADGTFVGAYSTVLSMTEFDWEGIVSISLPPGSYQAYALATVLGSTGYSTLWAFAVSGQERVANTFDTPNSTAPTITSVTPLPFSAQVVITTLLASTLTDVNGNYGLGVTGITYGSCTNSLQLIETAPANYSAVLASAPSPGTVISATEIDYPPVSGGNYPNNNLALASQFASPGQTWKVYYRAGSQLIAMRTITQSGNVLYFMSSDHLGSSSLTTDANGTVVARQLYDAWGNVRSGGGLPTDIGYTSQRLDATGLTYMHARYYSNVLGRFVSADTIVPSGSDPQHFNRYSYVLNNPLAFVDPTGHFTEDALRNYLAGLKKSSDEIDQM